MTSVCVRMLHGNTHTKKQPQWWLTHGCLTPTTHFVTLSGTAHVFFMFGRRLEMFYTHTHASNESHTPRGVQRLRLFLASEDTELIQLVLPLAVRAHVCTRRTEWGMLGPKMFFPEPHKGFGWKAKTGKKRRGLEWKHMRCVFFSFFLLINLTKDAQILVISIFSFNHGFSAGSYQVNSDPVCFFARKAVVLADGRVFPMEPNVCVSRHRASNPQGCERSDVEAVPRGTCGGWWMWGRRRKCSVLPITVNKDE